MNSEFIKIFIINLQRSVDRRAEIIKKMNFYGLPYELFDAVDGKNIPDDVMQKINNGGKYREIYHRDMRRGEAGCALSHLELYKKIISEKIDYAIILEDDIEFDNRLKHIAENNEKVENVLKNYDLVLLGYCGHDAVFQKPGICSYWRRINLDKVIKVGIPVHWCWSTIGYLISYYGVQKILRQGELPLMQADFLTANSPVYGVRLGVIRNQIVWPGKLNEVSAILEINSICLDELKNDHFIEKVICRPQISKESFFTKHIKKAKSFYHQFKRIIKSEISKLSFKKYSFAIDKLHKKKD